MIDTDNKFADKVTFKNVVILISCAVQDDDKCYPQITLEEVLEA